MAAVKENGRTAALRLLEAVLKDRRPLDEALAKDRGLARLAGRDRAFARLLAATVLRRLGQIDALIDACLDRPLKPKLDRLRAILRLGAAQIVFLDTPPHAAVSSSVELAVGARLEPFRGLVNAVLRRLSQEGKGWAQAQDAARLSTPDWLWTAWLAAYGEATVRAIAKVHLTEPPLDLTVKRLEEREIWAERLGAEVLPSGSLRLPPGQGDVAELPGFQAGAWWVQDAAAALPAGLFGPLAGRRVVDLCAAPGGKTLQLAAAGAEVTALDLVPGRLKRVHQNLKRLELRATVLAADATTWRSEASFDAVLLDAPCSATGTLRRHPDIAHLKRPEDLAGLTALQDRLLGKAVDLLAPGGTLVYATCSLQPEEGPERIAKLLQTQTGLGRRAIAPAEVGGLTEAVTPLGDLRCLPCFWAERGGMDGFYACRLVRL